MNRWPSVAVAVFGASAVLLGAFGAHALRGMMTPDAMQVWHTAVGYQFWHTLALGLVALMLRGSFIEKCGRHGHFLILALRTSAIAFVLGIVLFCGSLYALTLGAPLWLGAVTPIGGVAFIVGWIALGIASMREFVE
ncbi:MAG: DUF423 domain-containing protein [Rhodanobacteraceae bacterium]|nr:DUF423 domain-containing protein [Pseudomonadota bacterium]